MIKLNIKANLQLISRNFLNNFVLFVSEFCRDSVLKFPCIYLYILIWLQNPEILDVYSTVWNVLFSFTFIDQ